jgi:hypothetical protein
MCVPFFCQAASSNIARTVFLSDTMLEQRAYRFQAH